MIDATREQLIDLEEAAAICKVTVKTIRIWMTRAVRRLETVKFGGKRMTSREAIHRFGQQDGGSTSTGVIIPRGPGPIDDSAAVQELERL